MRRSGGFFFLLIAWFCTAYPQLAKALVIIVGFAILVGMFSSALKP